MSWLSSIIGDIPGVGPIINDVGSALLNGAKGAISGGNAGSDIMTLLGVLNAAGLQGKANSYAGDALNTAQTAYDAKAPLRASGIAGMQYSATHGNPFAEGAVSTLPVAGQPPVGRPSVLPTAGQPSTGMQTGSALPVAGVPSVGQASTPPNPGNAGTPAALRVATTPGMGKAPPKLQASNALELSKLFG